MTNNYRELLIEAWEKEEQLINLINECLERIYPDMTERQRCVFKRQAEQFHTSFFIPDLYYLDKEAQEYRNCMIEKKNPCD